MHIRYALWRRMQTDLFCDWPESLLRPVTIWRKPVVSKRTQTVKLHKKISITSSKVGNWTRKTFWVNILRSLSQVRETIYTSKELTCIKTTGNREPTWRREGQDKTFSEDFARRNTGI